jgi:CTP-dependent riboflavin kinase
MDNHSTNLKGILVKGYQVASRPSKEYPYSALEKQKPFFKSLGLDLHEYFNGTLNISIAPAVCEMSAPESTFEFVEWTDLHPPETFSFSHCMVKFEEKEYDGWVYYPHPETKKTHFQDPSLIEIICREIPNIKYGDSVEVEINNNEITVSTPSIN